MTSVSALVPIGINSINDSGNVAIQDAQQAIGDLMAYLKIVLAVADSLNEQLSTLEAKIKQEENAVTAAKATVETDKNNYNNAVNSYNTDNANNTGTGGTGSASTPPPPPMPTVKQIIQGQIPLKSMTKDEKAVYDAYQKLQNDTTTQTNAQNALNDSNLTLSQIEANIASNGAIEKQVQNQLKDLGYTIKQFQQQIADMANSMKISQQNAQSQSRTADANDGDTSLSDSDGALMLHRKNISKLQNLLAKEVADAKKLLSSAQKSTPRV